MLIARAHAHTVYRFHLPFHVVSTPGEKSGSYSRVVVSAPTRLHTETYEGGILKATEGLVNGYYNWAPKGPVVMVVCISLNGYSIVSVYGYEGNLTDKVRCDGVEVTPLARVPSTNPPSD